MGRQAAYTGQTITWEQISAMSMNLVPAEIVLGPVDFSNYPVPVPGSGTAR